MLKYQSVAQSIEHEIQTKDLTQGERLPSLTELMTQYNTSKSTIIKALDVLEKNNRIFQVRGSGIFVRRNQRKGLIDLQTNRGFSSDMEDARLSAKVLSFAKVTPTNEICQHLRCSPDEPVFHVKRLRLKDNKILCVEDSYYLTTVVPYLNTEILEHSIFEYLKTSYQLQVGFSEKYLSVGKLSQSNADYLTLSIDDPCLITHEIFYSRNGVPFDYSTNTYHYLNANFFLQITNTTI